MYRVEYLVIGGEVSIYTVYANLVQLYNPYGNIRGFQGILQAS